MPDVAELGRKVKAKYPGVYDDLSDADVGVKVKAKFPGAYDDFTDVAKATTRMQGNISFGSQDMAGFAPLNPMATPGVDVPGFQRGKDVKGAAYGTQNQKPIASKPVANKPVIASGRLSDPGYRTPGAEQDELKIAYETLKKKPLTPQERTRLLTTGNPGVREGHRFAEDIIKAYRGSQGQRDLAKKLDPINKKIAEVAGGIISDMTPYASKLSPQARKEEAQAVGGALGEFANPLVTVQHTLEGDEIAVLTAPLNLIAGGQAIKKLASGILKKVLKKEITSQLGKQALIEAGVDATKAEQAIFKLDESLRTKRIETVEKGKQAQREAYWTKKTPKSGKISQGANPGIKADSQTGHSGQPISPDLRETKRMDAPLSDEEFSRLANAHLGGNRPKEVIATRELAKQYPAAKAKIDGLVKSGDIFYDTEREGWKAVTQIGDDALKEFRPIKLAWAESALHEVGLLKNDIKNPKTPPVKEVVKSVETPKATQKADAPKRQVYLDNTGKTTFVRYVDRNYGQRHAAAQFDATQFDDNYVKDWIAKQPGIELADTKKTPAVKPVETGKEPKLSDAHIHIKNEGGAVKRNGATVEVSFKPQVKPSDVPENGTPDESLNPNSFLGSAELSMRQTYRKVGGREMSAGISNAVNQGTIMQKIDAMRFDADSPIVGVTKKAGEPFQIKFKTEADAVAFEGQFKKSTQIKAEIDALKSKKPKGHSVSKKSGGSQITKEDFADLAKWAKLHVRLGGATVKEFVEEVVTHWGEHYRLAATKAWNDVHGTPPPKTTPKVETSSTGASSGQKGSTASHADIDEFRQAVGLQARKESPETISQWVTDAAKHSGKERLILKEVADGDAPLSPSKQHALLVQLHKLRTEIRNAKNAGNEDAWQIATDEANEVADALDVSGSRAGRSMRARQIIDAENYDRWSMERKFKKANMDEELNPKQRGEFEHLMRQLEDRDLQLADKQKRIDDLMAELSAKPPKPPRGSVLQRRRTAINNLSRLIPEVKAQGGFKSKQTGAVEGTKLDFDLGSNLRVLAKTYIEDGAKTFDEIVEKLGGVTKLDRDQILYYLSASERKLKLEANIAKSKLTIQMNAVKRQALEARKPLIRKIGEEVLDGITTTQKVFGAGGEGSMALIQGRKLLMINPAAWTRGLWEGIKAVKGGEEAVLKTLTEIESDLMFPRLKQAGYSPSEFGGPLGKQEEYLASRLLTHADKLPGLAGKIVGANPLTRAQIFSTAFMNKARYDSIKWLASFDPENPQFLKDVVMQVNILSGRGSGRVAESLSGQAFQNIAYAPRYYYSKVQYTAGQPLWGSKTKGGKAVALAGYATHAAYIAGLMAVAKKFGWEVDTDIRSTNFGYAKIGDQMIDFFGKEADIVKFAARMYYGSVSEKGNFNAPGDYGNNEFERYITGKASPVLRTLYEKATGRLHEKEDGSWEKLPLAWTDITSGLVPMTYRDLYEQGTQSNSSKTQKWIVGGLQLFGENAKLAKRQSGQKIPSLDWMKPGFQEKSKSKTKAPGQ